MIRRFFMRRAYNSGDWEQARRIAKKLLHIPKEEELARSIIIRSHYNEGSFDKVVHLNSIWNNSFHSLVERINDPKSRTKIQNQRIQNIYSSQPEPASRKPFDAISMINNFHQEGNRVWMRHPEGYIYWDMPENYILGEAHPDLLRLTAEILLFPWYPSTKTGFDKTRPKGTEVSLSFSAGIDSTAAMLVMPETTVLGYHRRSFDTILDHRNADRLLRYLRNQGKSIVDVSSNHELIRTYHNKQVGFSSDFASSTHIILLADFLDIRAIGFGTPIDNTYLWKGRKYRDFAETKYYNYWTERFLEAGIDLLFPIASISEGGALEIIKQSPISNLVNSCLRGNGMKGCGRCWKCFHKNGPLGREFELNSSEIQMFLQRDKIPTTTHVLWAIQYMGIAHKVPLSESYSGDYSWWTKFYEPGFDILRPEYQGEIMERIKEYLQPMNAPYLLEKINHYDE